MNRVHRQLSTANVALGSFVGNVAASFARMAVHAAGGLFEGTIKGASNLNEAINKTNVVFGDAAGTIIGNANKMADSFGLPRKAIIDASGTFGILAQKAGQSGEAAAKFGNDMTQLAVDAMSLYNVPLEESLRKIQSGLAGQSRPLREFGVFLNIAEVNAEALRLGLAKTKAEISEGDKITARASLITKGLALAQGDMANTSGQTEGQMRRFWGTLRNLGEDIGQLLLPAFDSLLSVAVTAMKGISKSFQDNKETYKGWVDSVIAGFDTVKTLWTNYPAAVEISQLTAAQYMDTAQTTIEQWATQAAVYIEIGFLKGAQAVGDFFNTLQNYATTAVSYLILPAQYLMTGFMKAFEAISNAWDTMIGYMARGIDFLLRPLRDLANATGLGMKNSAGKDMSMEEDVNRLQGALGGLKDVAKSGVDFFKAMQDNLGIAAQGKSTDFTSGLIDKANKHLADVMGKKDDALQNRIADLTANMTATVTGKTAAGAGGKGRGKGKGGPGGDDDEDVLLGTKKKHQKMLEDTASFAMNLQAGNLAGDVQDKQLTELQQIRAIEAQNAASFEKMLQRQGMAVFG